MTGWTHHHALLYLYQKFFISPIGFLGYFKILLVRVKMMKLHNLRIAIVTTALTRPAFESNKTFLDSFPPILHILVAAAFAAVIATAF